MCSQDVLDLCGVDVLSSRDEHVLDASRNVVVAVLVLAADIAALKPGAVGERILRCLLVSPVPGRYSWTREPELAFRTLGYVVARRVNEAHAGKHLRFPDGSDLPVDHRLVHDEDGRPGLGHTHAVADAGAAFEIGLDQVIGHRRTAATPVPDLAQIKLPERGMQRDLLVHGRYTEKRVELACSNQRDHLLEIEAGKHENFAAFDQRRKRDQVDTSRVEQRQIVQANVVTADRHRLADIHIVGHCHAWSLDDRFGFPGRP